MRDNVETLANALESEYKCPPSLPILKQDLTPAPPWSSPQPFSDVEQRVIMQKMVREKAKRLYTSRIVEATSKVAEKKLSDGFQIDYEPANGGSKTISFRFGERVWTEIAENVALGEECDHNVER